METTTLDNEPAQSSHFTDDAAEIQRGNELANATQLVSPLHFPQAGPLPTKVITGLKKKKKKNPERNNMHLGIKHLFDSCDDLANIHVLRQRGMGSLLSRVWVLCPQAVPLPHKGHFILPCILTGNWNLL